MSEQKLENTEKTDEKLSKPWQFQKGEDPRRNLDGRPVGAKNLTSLVRDALKELGGKVDGKEVSYETALVKTILHKAVVKQDNKMIELLWNYLDGKPLQSLNVTAEMVMNPLTDEQKKKLEDLLNGNPEPKTETPAKQASVEKDAGGDDGRAPIPGKS